MIIAACLLLGAVPSAAAHSLPAAGGTGTPSAPAPLAASVHVTIPIGTKADGLAYDPKNFDVYIANQGSNNVSVISSVTHAHFSIAVGKAPYGVTFDPDNGKLYVANYNSTNLSIISGSTNKVVANPSLGANAHPVGSFFDPASGNVLVLNSSSDLGLGVGWMIINATNAVKKLTFGLGTIDYAGYNPKSKDLYLPNFLAGTISAITGSGAVTTIKVGGYPNFVYVNPANNDTYAYGTDGPPYLARISVISSSNQVVKNLTLHSVNSLFPNPFGYDPSTKNSYFDGFNGTTNKSSLVVISSTNTVSATISLGVGEFSYAVYDPANRDMYLTSIVKSIVVVSGTTITKTLKLSQSVSLLVYDPTLKDMVGAGEANATTASILYLITSANAVSSLKVGKLAIAAFYDPKDTYVYVVNIGSKNVELVG